MHSAYVFGYMKRGLNVSPLFRITNHRDSLLNFYFGGFWLFYLRNWNSQFQYSVFVVCVYVFFSAAEAEIEEAYRWYEEQRKGLGFDFLLCIEDAIEKISRNPELYPLVHKNVRRALIHRFPY